jgi:aryl-alcohol dehydrogenase-like predicted oxidoreductase
VGAIQQPLSIQGYGERFKDSDIKCICDEATKAGINYYDTAEVYGYQNTAQDLSSESLIRRCEPLTFGRSFFNSLQMSSRGETFITR